MNDTLFLYRFFIKDALRGIADKPFLRKKSGRVILGTVIVGAYAAYIFFNVKSVADMGIKAGDVNDSLLNLTLSSFVNVMTIAASLMFVFSQASMVITNRALFFAKKLPFKNKEVSRAQALFKITLAAVGYELFLLCAFYGIKLIAKNAWQWIAVFLLLHMVFIVTYGILNILLQLTVRIFKHRKASTVYFIVVSFLTMMHFEETRFTVDYFFGRTGFQYNNLLIIFFVAAFVLFSIVIAFHLLADLREIIVFKPKFISVPCLPMPIRASWHLKAVLRTPHACITLLLFIFLVIARVQWGTYKECMYSFVDSWPLTGVMFLPYCDSTFDMRVMNLHYGIKPVKEWFMLISTFAIIMLPTLAVGLFYGSNETVLYYFMGISLCAVSTLIGFIFPRSKGGMNEFFSALIFMLVIVMLIILMKTSWGMYLSAAVFSVLIYVFLNADRRLSK